MSFSFNLNWLVVFGALLFMLVSLQGDYAEFAAFWRTVFGG